MFYIGSAFSYKEFRLGKYKQFDQELNIYSGFHITSVSKQPQRQINNIISWSQK